MRSPSVADGDRHRAFVTCDLDVTPLAAVRRVAHDLLAGYSGVAVEDAVLVVDELASNASRHGQPPRLCRLALVDRGRRLRVEVDDAAPEQPRIRPADETGGRGLPLVDRLASAWGVQQHKAYKTVWAEVMLDRRGPGNWTRHLTLSTPS